MDDGDGNILYSKESWVMVLMMSFILRESTAVGVLLMLCLLLLLLMIAIITYSK